MNPSAKLVKTKLLQNINKEITI